MKEAIRFKGVIFDLDGTLLDTLRDIAEAMNRALTRRGFPAHPTSSYKQFVGEGAGTLARKVLREEDRTEGNIERLREEFIKDYRSNWAIHTRPYKGIVELLERLEKRGIMMAVLSNKPHWFTVQCVKRFLGGFNFIACLGESDETPRKPEPKGALVIKEMMGISEREILFVGDTKIDMQTAINASMTPCGVLWGFRDREELMRNGAEYIAEHPMAIENLLLY